MNNSRNWTVLFIGGASGTGKSYLAHALARHHDLPVIAVDDIVEALAAMTTTDTHPALHHWDTDLRWQDAGVAANVDWLARVSREIAPGIKAIADTHIKESMPVIIEGDFLSPASAAVFGPSEAKALFIHEPDRNQIIQNYLAREGGDAQCLRADISVAYGSHILKACKKAGVPCMASRPWHTALDRAIACLSHPGT